jgi:hypothetical protein
MPKFNPLTLNPPKDYESFQIHNLRLTGELAKRARDAARTCKMHNAAFVEACIKYAIDNMELPE